MRSQDCATLLPTHQRLFVLHQRPKSPVVASESSSIRSIAPQFGHPVKSLNPSARKHLALFRSCGMISTIIKYDARLHLACEPVIACRYEKSRRALNYSDLRGNIRIDEKSNKSRTSSPNDFAMRSSVAGLGHPFPSSKVATRRALSLTLEAYSSRLIPAKSRSSLILAPNCRCKLVTR
jgi:hypothetical protein